MDWSNPFRALTPTVDGDVLLVLASGDVQMSGRHIASRVPGRSYEGVRLALARLVNQGVVRQERVGRAQAFRLNLDHILAPALVEIAGARTALLRRLQSLVEQWIVVPELVVLFGSVVRGDSSATSDIDVLVVSRRDASASDDVWAEQLLALQLAIHSMSGNDARILEYSLDEFRQVRSGAVVEAIDYGIPVFGSLVAARRIRKAV